MRAAFAAFAIAVLGNFESKRVGPQVSRLAQERDRRLRVTVLQLAIGWAHAAKRLDLAAVADRRTRARLVANLAQRAFPAFDEATLSNVVALLVRDHADAHRSVRVDGAAGEAAAAGIFLPGPLGHFPGRGKVAFGHALVICLALGLGKVEFDRLLRRKPDGERALGAINPRIDGGVEFELHAKFFLGEPLHLEYFVPVDCGGHRFELQGKFSIEKQANASHAAVIGAWNLRQRFVRLARRAVERNFDGKRPIFGEVIGDARVDHRAVREQRNQKAALLGFGVNLKKILAREDLAARVKQPEAACVDQFIEEAAMLFQGEFLGAGRVVAHRQVVVAMEAFEGTSAGDLDRHLERRTFPLETLVDQACQFAVGYRLHV